MAGLFSKLGYALGLKTRKTSLPDLPAFPETQYAQAIDEQQRYAQTLQDLLSRRRLEGLGAQGRTQQRQLAQALARRGLAKSGTAIRGMREIQEGQRLGRRDIESERDLAIQRAVAERAAQQAEAARWYSGLTAQRQEAQTSLRAQRRAQQSSARLATLLGLLGATGSMAGAGVFGGMGGGAATPRRVY